MEFMLRMDTTSNVIITRVENGWIIRTDDRGMMSSVPMKVAKTSEDLVSLLRDWADKQVGAVSA